MPSFAEERRKHNRELGILGEAIAAEFLKGRGFTIVEQNFKGPSGEIDIIARDGDVLVFCEVKTRDDEYFGPPECALTYAKQRAVRRTAHAFLYMLGIEEQECRFDVVAVYFGNGGREITYFPNAFFW